MKAFGVLFDGNRCVVRALDEEAVRSYFDNEIEKVVLLPPDVANAMGVPEAEGRYDDVVINWEHGPTDLLGDLHRD